MYGLRQEKKEGRKWLHRKHGPKRQTNQKYITLCEFTRQICMLNAEQQKRHGMRFSLPCYAACYRMRPLASSAKCVCVCVIVLFSWSLCSHIKTKHLSWRKKLRHEAPNKRGLTRATYAYCEEYTCNCKLRAWWKGWERHTRLPVSRQHSRNQLHLSMIWIPSLPFRIYTHIQMKALLARAPQWPSATLTLLSLCVWCVKTAVGPAHLHEQDIKDQEMRCKCFHK